MKKKIRKLGVRSETIRTLRVVEERDLTHVAGGSVVQAFESNDNCPVRLAVATAACG
jgi:hypothetical protein